MHSWGVRGTAFLFGPSKRPPYLISNVICNLWRARNEAECICFKYSVLERSVLSGGLWRSRTNFLYRWIIYPNGGLQLRSCFVYNIPGELKSFDYFAPAARQRRARHESRHCFKLKPSFTAASGFGLEARVYRYGSLPLCLQPTRLVHAASNCAGTWLLAIHPPAHRGTRCSGRITCLPRGMSWIAAESNYHF